MSTSVLDISRPNRPPGSGATPQSRERAQRRDPRVIEDDWDKYFDSLASKLEDTEKSFDRIKYREGVRNQKYYEGEYFWRFSEYDDSVRDLPHSSEDPFYPHNWYAYFTDLSVAAALEATPDIIIDPAGRDSKTAESASAAQRLADYNEQELLTEEFRLESEKTRQLYSGVWWYSQWSYDAGRLWIEHPIYEESWKQTSAQTSFMCECGGMGPLARLIDTGYGRKCPDCGSQRQQFFHGPETSIQEIIGYEKQDAGFPSLRCVSPLQMKGDRTAAHYMSGEWLRWKRLVDSDAAAEIMPWWEPGSSKKGAGMDDAGIRSEELARRPTGMTPASLVAAGSADATGDRTVAEDWWFRPSKYSHIEFNQDIVFVGQEETTVPAYTRLGEVFPKGLRMTRLGSDWVDHYEEDFRRHWVYVPYVYVPHKTDGRTTLSDMCEPQMEMIKARSLQYLYYMARAGGMPTIIKAPLSAADYDGSPAGITELPFGAPPVQELIYQGQYPPSDPGLAAYPNTMSGEMQVMAQVVSPNTTGDPNAMEMGGTDTARGMMIMNAKAMGLQGPKLMPLAFGQARAVEQWIEMFRENVTEDVPVPLRGDTGTAEWVSLNGADMEGDFHVYPRPGSWIPHPREEKQAALQNMWSVFGQLFVNPQTPPEAKQFIATLYGLGDMPMGDFSIESRNAKIRIEQLCTSVGEAKQIAEWHLQRSTMGITDENNIAQLAGQILSSMHPVDSDLDDAQSYETEMKAWLRGDESKAADPIAVSAIRSQWMQYRQIVQQQQQQDEQHQIQLAQAMEGVKASSKTQGDIALEKTRQEGRLNEIGAKGLADHAKAMATPAPAVNIQPPPVDNTMRDSAFEHLLDKDREAQQHKHRLAETITKGAIDAALKPPTLEHPGQSQAGMHNALASGYPQVPPLPGIPQRAAM